MNPISQIFDTIASNEVTYFFCVLIAGWLTLAVIIILVRSLAQSSVGTKFVAMTPNCLTTLGVLGTFTGILIGLLDFDVTKVDDSVPELLAGLKIAFTTSIVGIAAAISFRLVRTLTPTGSSSEGVTPEDIQSTLLEIRDDGRASASRSEDQMNELRTAISSEGDSSLLTQVQKLRTTLQDGQTELIREFRDFAKHMVENNQKAIVEALRQVIQDFNQNLTEQFGENFKELNHAVTSLVDWQDRYREHVEALEARLDTAVSAVEASQRALESIQTHSERIPEAIKPLEAVLIGLETQTQTLGSHLETLASLREKAVEAFPVIEANLEKITTQFATAVDDAVEKSRRALADGEKAQSELRQGHEALLKDAVEARERFSTELTNALKQMSEQSAREFARHGELIETASKDAQKVIVDSWNKSADKMNVQFTEFDNQMQQELKRSLELLGKSLASVSEKFVSDYTPLTQRLHDLVQISKGVK